jgi:hypothetical protein
MTSGDAKSPRCNTVHLSVGVHINEGNIMNNTTSTMTDNHEVIPVLTAENYADVRNRFQERPIPAQFLEQLRDAGQEIGRCDGLQEVTTIDGDATKWLVSVADDKMWLDTKLPCSVAHCDGHSMIDCDNWDDLSHTVASFSVPDMGVGNVSDSDGSVDILIRSGGPVVSYRFVYEGELEFDEIDELIAKLRENVIGLQALKQAAVHRMAE